MKKLLARIFIIPVFITIAVMILISALLNIVLWIPFGKQTISMNFWIENKLVYYYDNEILK